MSHQKTGRAPIISVVKDGEKQPPDEEGKYRVQEQREAEQKQPKEKEADPDPK